MKETLSQVLSHYQLDSRVTDCIAYGQGHINKTYLVTTMSGRRYILQKINNKVFKNVEALMVTSMRSPHICCSRWRIPGRCCSWPRPTEASPI